MNRPDVPSVLDSHRHAVKFYQSDESLFTTVGGFLSQGLVDGQPAILIATRTHRDGILAELAARLIDVNRALRLGQLIALDAHEILATFMVDDIPDSDAFQSHVGGMLGDAINRRNDATIVRAYGEMVDVLWKQRRQKAAIRLEILWNKLAAQYGFALLCGYAMGNFYKETALFEQVCQQHTHVMPPDPEPLSAHSKITIQ